MWANWLRECNTQKRLTNCFINAILAVRVENPYGRSFFMSFVISVWNSTEDIVLVFVALAAFLLAVYFAIIPHEIAHGLVAKWNGDLTAKVNGRLTLNPAVHFDPIGFVMLLFMGFGYAKPVPVNPYNFKVPRRGLFTVAIAGVVYNLAAMIVSCFFLALTIFIGQSLQITYAYYFFYWFFYLSASINVMLFLFNLLPLGPLDGFKIIEAYANRDNSFISWLRRYGVYILVALFVIHFAVYYIGAYGRLEFIKYFDLLGLYLDYGTMGIAGSVQSLFNLMFGLPSGFELFGVV